MIDPEIRRLFNELFETTLRERRIALPQAVANVKAEASAHGAVQTGPHSTATVTLNLAPPAVEQLLVKLNYWLSI